jgi:hypothetical protein
LNATILLNISAEQLKLLLSAILNEMYKNEQKAEICLLPEYKIFLSVPTAGVQDILVS